MQSPTRLRHVPAVDAVGAVRAPARGRRSRTSRSWCSSSTRRICCSTTRPRRCCEKIEQVVRLIRSKGVGVYFVTQNPLDIPDTVLGQLGNRVQHALRAFTPRDQKAVQDRRRRPCARTRSSISRRSITELGVGEALVSFLDEKGRPTRGRARLHPAARQPHRPGHARRSGSRSSSRRWYTATTSRRSIASRRTRN